MFAVKRVTDEKGNLLIQDPPIAQFLFQNTKASVIWLVLRLWLAYEWLETSGLGPVIEQEAKKLGFERERRARPEA